MQELSAVPLVVITGSSRGLGKALALFFLKKNYIVVGSSRGESDIQGKNYHHYKLDIGNESSVRSWVREIKNKFGRVDVLICNASLVKSILMLTMTPSSEVEPMFRTNYLGTFYVLREISKIMILQRYGRIITISSTMTLLHEEGTSVYSATKAAVTETTKVLARELSPAGITCNVIAPAIMLTDSSEALSKSSDWKERMMDKQTFKRYIDFDEICHIADFFISPMSRSVTGQVIHVGMIS